MSWRSSKRVLIRTNWIGLIGSLFRRFSWKVYRFYRVALSLLSMARMIGLVAAKGSSMLIRVCSLCVGLKILRPIRY